MYAKFEIASFIKKKGLSEAACIASSDNISRVFKLWTFVLFKAKLSFCSRLLCLTNVAFSNKSTQKSNSSTILATRRFVCHLWCKIVEHVFLYIWFLKHNDALPAAIIWRWYYFLCWNSCFTFLFEGTLPYWVCLLSTSSVFHATTRSKPKKMFFSFLFWLWHTSNCLSWGKSIFL